MPEKNQSSAAEWDRTSAIVNSILMGLPVPIGAYALARYKPTKLIPYLIGATSFVTVWRRFICARCRYYGRQCSTMMGITTSLMMPRDESKPLDREAMIADFTYIGALVLFPMPQVFKRARLAALYLLSAAAALGAIQFNACGRCENDFCPMKDLHRIISS